MIEKLNKLCIPKSLSVFSALKRMDEQKRKLLIVVDNDNSFYRLLSIGDIQRAIIGNINLSTSVDKILRSETTFALFTVVFEM